MIFFPNCKINLGLHILRKRTDGYHDLETIFYPIALQDAIEVIQHPTPINDIEFSASGAVIAGNQLENTCVKAYQILKKDFPDLLPVKMHLHKTIPMGAGLGGGSADGAFTLMLLNNKFHLGLTEEALTQYALLLGSDCPFFIKNTPCRAGGRGEILETIELDLSSYKLVLVNPQIHVNTSWAFKQVSPDAGGPSLIDVISNPVENWRDRLSNDFENIVFKQYPEVKACKVNLYENGALYASMSGSGSSVYGIFPKEATPRLSFPPHYFVKII